MGVRTTLAGITLTAGDKTQAEGIGADIVGLMQLADVKCRELTQLLTLINTEVLTPAGDSSNATTVSAQITALA